ncbi:MAG: helix-hairpin-helix domain-containing protein [Nitrospirota bacterium]
MTISLTGKAVRILLMACMLSLIISSVAFAAKNEKESVSINIEDKININSASAKEMSTLPGIGKKKAEAIIAYRKQNGSFSSIDDLKKVEGIGKKTLERIKAHVTTEGG